MLENMRRQGASIFIYLIFGVLIAIFVVQINPGQGQGSGCTPASNTVLTVDGSKVHENEYRATYVMLPVALTRLTGQQVNLPREQREQLSVEMLIRRELLAQAAADHGLRVTSDMVEEEIKKGRFFVGGHRLGMGAYVFDYQRSQICDVADPPAECKQQCFLGINMEMCSDGYHCTPVDDEGGQMGVCDARCTPGGNQCGPKETCTDDGRCALWSANRFKNWIGQLNVSQRSYKSEQAREMQANLMQELLLSEVRVSREEVRDTYLHRKSTVKYDTVVFSPEPYAKAMKLTDADIARYLAAHEDEVKAKFKADERNYTDVKPQLRLRRIYIQKAEPKAADAPKPADPAAPADPAKPAEAAKPAVAAKPVGLPIEEAKAKLEAARTAIAAKQKKFVDAVKELSTDEADKANGGLLPWKTAENAGLGDKALSDAVKSLKPGEMTPVIAIDNGVYLYLAEDLRPTGDAKNLTYDQVKHEIAEQLARTVWSKEAAKRAALEAHAELVKSNKPLSSMFPKDVKQQLDEQIKTGALDDVQIIDTPVAWKYEQPNGSSGGSAAGSGSAAPAAGSAAPAAGSAAPAAGSAAPAAGSAAPAGSGAGSGSAASPTPTPTPTPTPAPAPVEKATLEPSKDQLPAFGTVAKPQIVSHGPTPRREGLPGVPPEVVPVLFDTLLEGQLAPRVYELPRDGGYVLVQVTDKGEASTKVEDFEKEFTEIYTELKSKRAISLMQEWLRAKCEALAKDDKIEPRADIGVETDDKGNQLPSTYRPCQSFAVKPQ